jgi:hypothetical protein
MRAYVLSKTPGAVLPRAEQPYCPGSEIELPDPIYRLPAHPEVLCDAEYHVGSTWGSVAAEVELVRGAVRIYPQWHKTWIRRWARCPKSGWADIAGTMESNNNCGDETYPISDWSLAVNNLYPPSAFNAKEVATAFRFQPDYAAGWSWMDSAGYALGTYYRTARHGNAYTYTNVVGDSFRIRP